MAAKTTPPEYGFAYVLEYPGGSRSLDPSIPFLVTTYSEPQRMTRAITIDGSVRPVAFLRERTERDRRIRFGWTDMTEQFNAEWSSQDGVWTHTPPGTVVDKPDSKDEFNRMLKTEPQNWRDLISGNGGSERVTVKRLTTALNTGYYDGHLNAMLQAERSSSKPRNGAVTAILNRKHACETG